jgi:hypothetical protein
MAITIQDQPYAWSPRGQKLMIVATSSEYAQDGFKYGVEVTNTDTGKTYTFFLSPALDNRLYFDMQSLVQLRNKETELMHATLVSATFEEGDNALNRFNFIISEYWIVAGVLTLNTGSEVEGSTVAVVNGYYQISDGYKPSANGGIIDVKYALNSNQSRMMSDRFKDTHIPRKAIGGTSANNIFIPVREEDYGMLFIPGNTDWLVSNDAYQYRIILYDVNFNSNIGSWVALNGFDIEGLGVYPANINADDGYDIKPSDFSGWKFYQVNIKGTAGAQKSEYYIFYNICEYGRCECIFETIRLGWVNSRSGWDYFNFNKRSEFNNEIDRKVYRRNLFNSNTTIFNKWDRGLYQRQNLVQRVLSVTSDFIQQGEFELLRGLLASNQVHWIHDDGTFTPVNIDDTAFTEKNTRDGKLYNVTLKVRMANEYWT